MPVDGFTILQGRRNSAGMIPPYQKTGFIDNESLLLPQLPTARDKWLKIVRKANNNKIILEKTLTIFKPAPARRQQ
jgi:hypothetical protein